MKMINALLVGSAAALVGFSAQAADLPKKSAPAEFVRVCQGQGAGFFIIPGSDTCLKIGGYARMDAVYGENTSGAATAAGLAVTQPGASASSAVNNYSTRARGVVNFDARTATGMGTLRSYVEFQMTRGTATSSSPDATIGSGNGQYSRSTLASLNSAFIQFAGLTAGLAASPFAMAGYNGSIALVANQVSGGYLPAGVGSTQLAYTAALGNGISATLALVDAAYTRQGALATAGGGFSNLVGVVGVGGSAAAGIISNPNAADGIQYAGNQVPDVVANLNITQAWGSAQIMGAYHQVKTAAVDGTGYAVGGGLNVNLPFIGPGSALWVQAVYSKGANVYAFDNGGSDGLAVDRNTIGTKTSVSKFSDGMINNAGGLDMTQVFSLHGGLRTVFSPTIQTGLFAGYTKLNSPKGGSTFTGAGTLLTGYNNLSDFTLLNIGANITYSPVRNLNLSLEAVYYNMKQAASGTGVAYSGTTGVYSAAATPDSGANTFAVGARVQRNF